MTSLLYCRSIAPIQFLTLLQPFTLLSVYHISNLQLIAKKHHRLFKLLHVKLRCDLKAYIREMNDHKSAGERLWTAVLILRRCLRIIVVRLVTAYPAMKIVSKERLDNIFSAILSLSIHFVITSNSTTGDEEQIYFQLPYFLYVRKYRL